jgi:hypothetical protein
MNVHAAVHRDKIAATTGQKTGLVGRLTSARAYCLQYSRASKLSITSNIFINRLNFSSLLFGRHRICCILDYSKITQSSSSSYPISCTSQSSYKYTNSNSRNL